MQLFKAPTCLLLLASVLAANALPVADGANELQTREPSKPVPYVRTEGPLLIINYAGKTKPKPKPQPNSQPKKPTIADKIKSVFSRDTIQIEAREARGGGGRGGGGGGGGGRGGGGRGGGGGGGRGRGGGARTGGGSAGTVRKSDEEEARIKKANKLHSGF
ncbi:hypothetical protein HYFRA_00010556 [Hymenoscyphus fraxineus]|uniref:Uncharacterized protein n=1 Tax=Hymenoscyphus fraxineus TaxID=746836 RepID=A0A9N9L8L9_9HELO|nr:hypothetical protein HYFRA_00010556 [Hymenoscyphus fraxineus]